MKLNIVFPFTNEAWGGGNQFLVALKNELKNQMSYAPEPSDADAILFNSHHMAEGVVKLRYRYPDKIFIHRIDGPMFLYRSGDRKTDDLIYALNRLCADGTVFQSYYSRDKSHETGLMKNCSEAIITNAPNPKLFNSGGKCKFENDRKIKLIATSWSANHKKGFDVYKWLDENLDFTQYEMRFVGNSDVKFQNIIHIPPLKSEELAAELKQNDIFVFASKIESCSNALLEALHCWLPAVVYDSTGNTELLSNGGGELFHSPEEIPPLLEKITKNYEHYQSSISNPTIEEVAEQYIAFAESILGQKEYAPKQISFITYMRWRSVLLGDKLKGKMESVLKKNIGMTPLL